MNSEVELPPGRIYATWMLTHSLPHARPIGNVGSVLKLRIPFQVEAGPCKLQVNSPEYSVQPSFLESIVS
jgi:hypothetical protein